MSILCLRKGEKVTEGFRASLLIRRALSKKAIRPLTALGYRPITLKTWFWFPLIFPLEIPRRPKN